MYLVVPTAAPERYARLRLRLRLRLRRRRLLLPFVLRFVVLTNCPNAFLGLSSASMLRSLDNSALFKLRRFLPLRERRPLPVVATNCPYLFLGCCSARMLLSSDNAREPIRLRRRRRLLLRFGLSPAIEEPEADLLDDDDDDDDGRWSSLCGIEAPFK